MHMLTWRRPEILFLASLLVLAVAFTLQRLQLPASEPVAMTTEAPAAVELSAESTIENLQERLRADPENTAAYAELGLALLQRVRETADPLLYTQAEQAFQEALKRDAQHLDALVGQGSLALSRHQFAEAVQWGEQARALNPYRAQIYGILGDAYIELGKYEAATEAIQRMVDTRPDIRSYSRVSYVRELHGDTAGAIEAMQRAVAAGNPGSEQMLWTLVQLGHLYFNSGELQRAEQTYLQALSMRPDYAYAFAGVARVQAAQGQRQEAIADYTQLVKRLPLPEFVIALGELYEVSGQMKQAQEQYDLVRVMQQLNASVGVDVDLELALFDADHGADSTQAVARAHAAYERRPGIYAADALAWALYHNGQYREAQRYSQEALRLGTRDALLHYHAAMIAHALSDNIEAREHLQEALTINPFFSVRFATQARALLEQLSTDGPTNDQ